MRIDLRIAAACVAALEVTPASAADPITLRVADSFPSGHYISEQITKWFMDRVAKETGNRIAFQYYPSEQLGKAKDLLTLTQTGVTDIGYVAPSFVTDKLPLLVVAELPLSFSTSCEGTAAYYKLATDGILAKRELAPNGVRLLFTIVTPPYQIFLRSAAFPGIDAIKGLKIRTSGKAKELAVQKLGAVSLQIASPDVYQSLSRGTIDGMLFPYSSIFSYDVQDLIKSASVGANSAMPILRQPSVHRAATNPQRSRDDLGAFASLYAAHSTHAHLFQCCVVQFSGVVLSHPEIESVPTPRVNKNLQILMDGLIILGKTRLQSLRIEQRRQLRIFASEEP
ncbi:MAG: TRAP transporter substrate-binding protein DctP [Bradyrhizobium sp.]